MLPAVPLPLVFSQMTRPDVEQLGVAEAAPVAATETVAAIVAAEARTAAPVSAIARIARGDESCGDRMVMSKLAFRLHGTGSRRAT
ncbi:MAG TPA: hypothetical protein VNZ01_10805 [Solirubrobacteraceae bacterium]|nr:hypothetical protein [Solirubrobacteraceae bacterium]